MKDSQSKGLQYALRLINIRERTEQELADKLKKKGFNEDTIRQILTRLKEMDLIDDKRAAETLINYGARVRGLSRKGLRRFCIEKGINEEIVDELITQEDDEKRAEELIRKKLSSMKDLSKEKKYRRLYGYLYRRGYPAEMIRGLLKKHLIMEAQDCEV